MSKFIGACVLIVIATSAFAQDSQTASKVHHLQAAAEHLQAAGLLEQANALRVQARHESLQQHRELLSRKLVELEMLQHEVQTLRRLTGDSEARQVRLEIKVLEFDKHDVAHKVSDVVEGIQHANALRRVDSEARDQPPQPGNVSVVDIPIEELVQKLRKLTAVKVISEPTVVVTEGRPATFHSGGEFPVLVAGTLGQRTVNWRPFGIHMEFVATRRDDGRLALEIAPEISEPDLANAVVLDGLTIPALTSCRCNTQAEMSLGQTLVLHGMRLGEKSVCVLVTPSRVIEPPSTIGSREGDREALQLRLAKLAEQFNKLMEARQFPEAELVAKQACESAPDDAVAKTMLWKSRIACRLDAWQRGQPNHGLVLCGYQGDQRRTEPYSEIEEKGYPLDTSNP